MTETETIVYENVARIRERIGAASQRANRNPTDITLIGVTKSVGRDAVDALIAAGVTDLGENRVQDALVKFGVRGDRPPLPPHVTTHMIGNLQSNKARDVVNAFNVVHSLNRRSLATALHQECVRQNRAPYSVLFEVNINAEDTKQGAEQDELSDLMGYVLENCPSLSANGLMTIAPHTDDPDAIRAAFSGLCELRDDLRRQFAPHSFPILSMGMSDDFEIAIEEGATHIRVGRALFVGLPPSI